MTLIEALVTVVIMSIGLLGLAALQNTSVKFTYDSYLRTQSSMLASDLFDRMRANPTVDYTDITATTGTDCTASDCNATTMMQYDFVQWRAQRDAIFNTNVNVVLTQDPAGVFSLEFKWDSRTTDGDLGTGPDGRQAVTYTARVK